MKPPIIATALFVTLLLASASGQTDTAREYKQLREQRDKAIAAATEPINRRYSASLELLLRRAMQAHDLETAVKIKEELPTLGVTSSVNLAVSPANLVGVWTLNTPTAKFGTRTLKPDGSVTDDDGVYG